ncbi:MAG TPA: hypothetical protein VK991_03065, partial [Halomonas sp.]|nr:hypothetical protein [Halomonas sp.]
MADRLDKLILQITSDSTQLKRDLSGVNQNINQFSDRATRSLEVFKKAAIAAFGVFSVNAIRGAISNAIDFADSIDKASQAAGVGAEFLQEFRFAADQSGLSMERADKALLKFNQRLGEAFSRGTGRAAEAFERLNVSLENSAGNARTAENVLPDIVRALEGVASEAERASLAGDLFGQRLGPELLPLLNQGTAGIDRLRQAARETGSVLSDELVADAVAAKDAMAELGTTADGLKNQFILQLAPALTDIAKAMNQAAKDAGLLEAAWVGLGGLGAAIFTDEFAGVDTLRDNLAGVNDELQRQQAILDALRDSGAPAASTGPVQVRVDELRAEAERLERRIEQQTREPAVPEAPTTTAPTAGDGAGTPTPTPTTTAPTAGDGAGTPTPTPTPKSVVSWVESMEKAGQAIREQVNPMEAVETKLTELDTLLQGGFISWDTYAEAAFNAMEGIEDRAEEATEEMSVFA